MDHLTKLAHFMIIRKDKSIEDPNQIYLDQIIGYYGILSSIILDIEHHSLLIFRGACRLI